MAGFRSREIELREYMKCYTQSDDPQIVLDNTSPYIVTIREFLLNEIKQLSTSQISVTMKNTCIIFAYDIAMALFEFDKQLFTDIFHSEINNNYPQVGFDCIFTIICGFKSTEIIIIGCSGIYKCIQSSTDNNEEEKYKKIFDKLKSFSDTECDALDVDMLKELRNLLSSLETSISS